VAIDQYAEAATGKLDHDWQTSSELAGI